MTSIVVVVVGLIISMSMSVCCGIIINIITSIICWNITIKIKH